MADSAKIHISANVAVNAIEKLVRLAVEYPEAVTGFVQSMKPGELITLTGDNFADASTILYDIGPSPALLKFMATLDLASAERKRSNPPVSVSP